MAHRQISTDGVGGGGRRRECKGFYDFNLCYLPNFFSLCKLPYLRLSLLLEVNYGLKSHIRSLQLENA